MTISASASACLMNFIFQNDDFSIGQCLLDEFHFVSDFFSERKRDLTIPKLLPLLVGASLGGPARKRAKERANERANAPVDHENAQIQKLPQRTSRATSTWPDNPYRSRRLTISIIGQLPTPEIRTINTVYLIGK